jgi:hypothetical protein
MRDRRCDAVDHELVATPYRWDMHFIRNFLERLCMCIARAWFD